MKPYYRKLRSIVVLAALFFASSDITGQNLFYTVQLITLEQEKINLESLPDNLESFTLKKDNLFIHNAGKFQDFSQAMLAMQDIKAKSSFKDAFVVPYLDGKRIAFHEARAIELKNAKTSANTDPDQKSPPASNVEEQNSSSEKAEEKNDYYPEKVAPKLEASIKKAGKKQNEAQENSRQLEVSLIMQTGHTDKILDIDIDPNNSLIASASKDNKIIVWDIKSGKQLMVLHGHKAAVNSVQFHPGESKLLSASDDGTVRIWDLMSTKEVKRFDDFGHPVKVAKYVDRAQKIVTAGYFIRVYDSSTGEYKRLNLAAREFFDVVESRTDKDHVVVGGNSEKWMYELRLSDLQIVSKRYNKLKSVELLDGDSLIYYTTPFGKYYEWDESTQSKEGLAANRSLNSYNAVAVGPNEIFLAEKSGLIRVFNKDTKEKIRTLNAHLGEVMDLELTSDGKYLISAGSDEYIILWEVATGRMMTTYKGGIERINQVKFSEDGTKMAVIFDDGLMKYWDLTTNEIITNSYKASALLATRGWKHMLSSVEFENDSSLLIQAFRQKSSWFDEKYFNKVYPEYLKWDLSNNRFTVLEPSKAQEEKVSAYFKREKGDTIVSEKYFLQDSSNFGRSAKHNYEVHIRKGSEIVLINDGMDTTLINSGHSAYISSVSFNPKYPVFTTASWDGIINIWHAKNKNLVVSLGSFGMDDFIYVDRDNYYYSSKGALNRVAFRMGMKAFEFDQFDLVYNRPDLVFSHLPYSDKRVLKDYKRAYDKRLSKMGVSLEELMNSTDIPGLELELPADLSSKNGEFNFRIKAKSAGSDLDRLQIFVNGVPEHGKYGLEINGSTLDTNMSIPLSDGNNKFQVFVIAKNGRASYKEYFEVINKKKAEKPDLYLITLGASEFKQSDFNLTYAQKDASDIQKRFNSKKLYDQVHSLMLLNEQITLEGVTAIDSFLSKARPDDVVLLFAAGHGVLDENLDYFYAAHDMDFNDPNNRGIPYQFFEDALGNSDSRKKVMFLDACHSGEVDKDEMMAAAVEEDVSEDDIAFRAVGLTAKRVDESSVSAFELSKELFADTRISNGSTVVSSAGAGEFAMEGDQWSNGVFTYSLLTGVETKDADLNKDNKIMLSELQEYLFGKVSELTDGKQRPTSRVENLTNDFRIW